IPAEEGRAERRDWHGACQGGPDRRSQNVTVFCRPPTSALCLSGSADAVGLPSGEARVDGGEHERDRKEQRDHEEQAGLQSTGRRTTSSRRGGACCPASRRPSGPLDRGGGAG